METKKQFLIDINEDIERVNYAIREWEIYMARTTNRPLNYISTTPLLMRLLDAFLQDPQNEALKDALLKYCWYVRSVVTRIGCGRLYWRSDDEDHDAFGFYRELSQYVGNHIEMLLKSLYGNDVAKIADWDAGAETHNVMELLPKSIQLIPATTDELEVKPRSTNDNRENIFNPGMPLSLVEEHFMHLATSNGRNGLSFLPSDQVRQFIDRAFVGDPFTGKLSLNAPAGDKLILIGLFHLFYTRCKAHRNSIGAFDKNPRVERYAKLMSDYFDNWAFDEIKDNFRWHGRWKGMTKW